VVKVVFKVGKYGSMVDVTFSGNDKEEKLYQWQGRTL
jgi:hypothetical protein